MRTTGWVAALTLVLMGAAVGNAMQNRDAMMPANAPLLKATDLRYEGAFRVPAGNLGASTFEYGGTGIAFDAKRQSLFIVGHDHHQRVAEISIPAVKSAPQPAALATATLLQPFTDITEGGLGTVGPNTVKIGGLLPYDGRLYLTAYVFYDAEGAQQLSHFSSGLDFSVQGDVQGPYQVGTLGAGFVSGYFGVVPPAWQQTLGGPVLNGNCCLSIISRTSYGPAVFVVDPATLGTKQPSPAKPLVYYTSSSPLLEPGAKGDGWSNTSTLFNGTSQVVGVVFPERTRSVLFFGRHGTGAFCYGEGSDCNDPHDTAKGNHAAPYSEYVWAYDANELAAVRTGRKQPWMVKPYAIWRLPLPFATGSGRLGGATYDAATARIFVSQLLADRELPIIHVLSVQTPAPTVSHARQ